MCSNLLWELTKDVHNAVIDSDMVISDLLQMPMMHWYEAEPNLVGLALQEAQFLVWGIDAMAIGDIPRALGMFEQRLLPLSLDRPPVWRSSLLMWSAMCRLYLCDTAMALAHIQTAQQQEMTIAMPEFELLKGMAFRLDGNLQEAINALNILARKRGSAYRFHARAWLFETMAAAGNLPTRQQVRRLMRENIHHYGTSGTIGIAVAAIYRIYHSHKKLFEPDCSHEDILNKLDSLPVFLRPMLTMLLADILPRPLAGVQRGTRSLESYWS